MLSCCRSGLFLRFRLLPCGLSHILIMFPWKNFSILGPCVSLRSKSSSLNHSCFICLLRVLPKTLRKQLGAANSLQTLGTVRRFISLSATSVTVLIALYPTWFIAFKRLPPDHDFLFSVCGQGPLLEQHSPHSLSPEPTSPHFQ